MVFLVPHLHGLKDLITLELLATITVHPVLPPDTARATRPPIQTRCTYTTARPLVYDRNKASVPHTHVSKVTSIAMISARTPMGDTYALFGVNGHPRNPL